MKDVVNVLEKIYGKNFKVSVIFNKNFKHINAIKNYYKQKYGARFSDYRRNNLGNLEEYILGKIARLPESKQLAMTNNSDPLVLCDYISLYPSAMAHFDSKWPKIQTEKAIVIDYSDRICSLFNNGDWKSFNKLWLFKVTYYNTKEVIFQHMSGKENEFNDLKYRYEEINRSRNGDITQHLTSVDIEVVRSGGYIVKIFEGFI